MFTAIGDVPDWVKLLGPPALWSLFLVCILWFLLNIVLSKWIPQNYVRSFFERNPRTGIFILLPVILSPVILLGFMLFNLWFQLIEPHLQMAREATLFREIVPNLSKQVADNKAKIDALQAIPEELRAFKTALRSPVGPPSVIYAGIAAEKQKDVLVRREGDNVIYYKRLIKDADGYCNLSFVSDNHRFMPGQQHLVEIRDGWWIVSITAEGVSDIGGFTAASCWHF